MCVWSNLLVECIVCDIVDPVVGLFCHQYTLPLPQLVIIRPVGLEQLGEKTTATFHLSMGRGETCRGVLWQTSESLRANCATSCVGILLMRAAGVPGRG